MGSSQRDDSRSGRNRLRALRSSAPVGAAPSSSRPLPGRSRVAATQSALHCPDCGQGFLIISEQGLSCACCGKLVRAIPPSMRPRAARAVRQLADRRRLRVNSNLHWQALDLKARREIAAAGQALARCPAIAAWTAAISSWGRTGFSK